MVPRIVLIGDNAGQAMKENSGTKVNYGDGGYSKMKGRRSGKERARTFLERNKTSLIRNKLSSWEMITGQRLKEMPGISCIVTWQSSHSPDPATHSATLLIFPSLLDSLPNILFSTAGQDEYARRTPNKLQREWKIGQGSRFIMDHHSQIVAPKRLSMTHSEQ